MKRLGYLGPGLATLGAFLCVLASCRRPSPVAPGEPRAEPAWFEDVTAASGLDFRHEAGPVGRYSLPQVMGSGVALLDFDNDGRLDVYLVHNGGPDSPARNRLFRQRPDGTFQDVSAGSGLDVAGYGMGVAVGDFDNDGWVDVYVSQYGGGRLFRNRGAGPDGRWRGFEDVTRSAGVEQPRWGTSCCFVDYDRDGWLDLVVVNYVDYDPSQACGPASGQPDYCHPNAFPGTAARLFRNRGRAPDGSWLGFEDVTRASGLAGRPSSGLGVACADFDGDGWPDILIANDARPNHLWINQLGRAGRTEHEPVFQEEAVLRGLALNALGNAQANMGVTLGDADGDGLFDVFITHLTEESHTLWRQDPRGQFRDRTAEAGLSAPRWRGTGFGTLLADFDHDGAPDLAVVNGRVARGPKAESPGLGPFWSRYAERNQLFANDGTGSFRDVSPFNPAFCGTPNVARGLAGGVLDNRTGAIDLVVTTVAGAARLYRNVASKRGHWLLVRAVDPALKRDAYGATVTVRAGPRRWAGLVNPGQSYLSSGDPRVHFGLGGAARVDEVRIDWPDGLTEVFPATPADRLVTLLRGRGRKVSP
jgi:hypothetical protein